jgi:hypothetical protein
MMRYLLVEVRVGEHSKMPTEEDWAAYTQVRDMIGMLSATNPVGTCNAEVGQVLELTTSGIRNRYGFIHPLEEAEHD